MIILDLCGGTGSWGYHYKINNYDVRLITLPYYDVLNYNPPKDIYGILAAPPCTEFSIVKNKEIKRDLELAMEIVNACLKIIEACKPKFWAMENPIGLLQKFIGKPKMIFQPWEFGDPWTKKTAIWGDFNIPKKIYNEWEDVPKIKELYIRPGRTKPSLACQHLSHKKFIKSFDIFSSNDDASFRSITPPGFAKAFFECNK